VSPLGIALQFVPDNIRRITHLVYGHYLKMVKARGVGDDSLTDIEDARFAFAVILNATCLGNGSNSVQKIIEDQVTKQDYLSVDIPTYVRRYVLPRVIESMRSTVNSEYDSIAHYAEYSTRQRIVSQVEFVDMLLSEEFKTAIVEKMVSFFQYAKEQLT